MQAMRIADYLSGGDPRSLGRTAEVPRLVLRHPGRVEELFECLFSGDETLPMRASDALEKVCRQRPELIVPLTRRLLTEVPKIDQPSVQWHLAQILARIPLSGADRRRAITILKRNLKRYDDWIVVNLTLEALAVFVRAIPAMQTGFVRLLAEFSGASRKSIARRAEKLLAEFPRDQAGGMPARRAGSFAAFFEVHLRQGVALAQDAYGFDRDKA
jgi:hypothetical protein